jgi:hypothetical protein
MRIMADTATETILIDAPHERVWEIATDIARYPEWARDIKEVVIVATDDAGRALEVEFRASALGRSTHYTLKYDYSRAPAELVWLRSTAAAPRCATSWRSTSSSRSRASSSGGPRCASSTPCAN